MHWRSILRRLLSPPAMGAFVGVGSFVLCATTIPFAGRPSFLPLLLGVSVFGGAFFALLLSVVRRLPF